MREGRATARAGVAWGVYAAATALPLAAVLVATLGFGIPPRAILGDAPTYTGHPFHLGLFSNLGLLGWWTAAVAFLLAAAVLPRRNGPSRAALATGGALSAVLGLDDLALLHEEVFPHLLGVPQELVFGAYLLGIIWYLWRFRAFHRAMEAGLLAVAVGLLGLSAAVDFAVDATPAWIEWGMYRRANSWVGLDLPAAFAVPDRHGMAAADYRRILEDGSKLAGITAWATYHARAARRVLAEGWGRPMPGRGEPPP